MRAVRSTKPGVTVVDVDEPEGPGELIKITSASICASDLGYIEMGSTMVLGHELAGVTEDGRRVALDPAIPCQACDLCLEGHPNLCEEIRFAGHGEDDGGLREWLAWPERCLFPLPASLSDADGAMLEPLGVALHAVDLAHLRPGSRVGVFGCGPIGLLVLQAARILGAARLFATDLLERPHRLEAARRLGAVVFAAQGGREARAIRDAMGGPGLDAAIETAGENAAVDAAIEAVRPGARVVLAGIPAEERTSFRASTARRKGLTLVLSRRMKHTYPRAIRLVEGGQVDLRSPVTHRFPLERGLEAFSVAARREGLKVLVQP
jgi:L-iditol 2-dehydrogenase